MSARVMDDPAALAQTATQWRQIRTIKLAAATLIRREELIGLLDRLEARAS